MGKVRRAYGLAGRWASRLGNIGREHSQKRDEHQRTECKCGPVRDIVEDKMLPCLSNVFGQEELRHWLVSLRRTIWICRCGSFYMHLWRNLCAICIRACGLQEGPSALLCCDTCAAVSECIGFTCVTMTRRTSASHGRMETVDCLLCLDHMCGSKKI